MASHLQNLGRLCSLKGLAYLQTLKSSDMLPASRGEWLEAGAGQSLLDLYDILEYANLGGICLWSSLSAVFLKAQ